MDLSPDGTSYTGKGFYLSAELDSSRRIHLIQDTLSIRIDSLWAVSSCFLEALELRDSLVDSTLFLRFDVPLRSTGDPACATSLFLPDTLLRIPMRASWSSIRRIIVTGTPRSTVFPDTSKNAVPDSPYLDTILVRSGQIIRDTASFYLDSLFFDKNHWPRRTPGDTSLLLRLDSQTVYEHPWRPVGTSCANILEDCPTITDTLWPTTWYKGKTAYIQLRTVCADTSRVYCAANGYTVKDTSAELAHYSDTTRHTSLYYLEPTKPCTGLDYWGPLSGTLSAKSHVYLPRGLFVPDANETDCMAGAISGWHIVNLTTNREITDSSFAHELLDDAARASIADTL